MCGNPSQRVLKSLSLSAFFAALDGVVLDVLCGPLCGCATLEAGLLQSAPDVISMIHVLSL